jgi:hypothetical protein
LAKVEPVAPKDIRRTQSSRLAKAELVMKPSRG